jgi:hypothetical protein
VDFPDVRCIFTDESETRLVQVQSDRFLLNWRKRKGTETYPRYEVVRDQFREEWAGFLDFLSTEGIPRPTVTRSDISYFNHFVQGEDWATLSDLPRLIAGWSGATSIGFLPEPETILVNASYRMPDDGKLHVILQPAIRHSDRKHILQLSLSARSKPKRGDTDAILEKFALGRTWIVNGFTDFTADPAHQRWGRTQ